MAKLVINAPRVGTAIKTDESYSLQKQLTGRRKEQEGLLPELSGGLTERNKQLLSRDHALDLQIEKVRNDLKVKSDYKVEEGEFYKSTVDSGMKLLEQYKESKHGKVDKVPKSFIPDKLSNYDKQLEKVWKSGEFSQKAKEDFTVGIAKIGQSRFTQETKDGYSAYLRDLEARKADLGNKIYGRGIRPVLQSAAQGVESLIAPARLAIQGEQTGMAYQEAAQLAAYVDPENTFSKYTHMIAANAAPMGAALGAAMIPAVGPALSGAVMGLPAGTDTLYELRRRGVDKDTAYTVAGFTALGTAATEMFIGKALSKVPVVGKLLPDEGARSPRIKKIIGSLGRKGKLSDVVDQQVAGKITSKELSEVLAKALSDTSRLGLLKDIGQATTAEAFTGGIEEWLQQGMQMGLTELGLKHEGLEGILPKNEDGSYNVSEILGEMNEAFKAGMILEGMYGAGGIAMGAKGRWSNAKQIESTKNYIRSTANQMLYNEKTRKVRPYGHAGNQETLNTIAPILEDAGYAQTSINQFSEESLDFIARRTMVQRMASDKGGVSEKQGLFNLDKAMVDSIDALMSDPVQAFLIDNGKNTTISEIVPGKAYTMKSGDTELVVAKSEDALVDGAGNQVAARYRSGADADTVEVSPELWAKLEKKGLGQDLVALNHYLGSTMAHELSHALIQNAPGDVGDAILGMYDKGVTMSPEEIQAWKERDADKVALDPSEEGSMYPEEAEYRTQQAEQARIDKLEAPSRAIEQRMAQRGGLVGDTYARIDVAVRGKRASESSKKRNLERQTIQSARTGSTVQLSHLGVAGPRIGRTKSTSDQPLPTVQRIGGKPQLTGEQQAAASETAKAEFDKTYPALVKKAKGYVENYSKAKNLNNLERIMLEKFMEDRMQKAINNESVYNAKNETEKRMVETHKKALVEMKGIAQTMPSLLKTYMSDENVKKRETRKAGVKKLQDLVKFTTKGELGQVPFDATIQKQYDEYMARAVPETSSGDTQASYKEDPFVQRVRSSVAGNAELINTASDAVEKANAKAMIQKNRAESTAKIEPFDELAGKAYAESLATGNDSIRLVGKPISTKSAKDLAKIAPGEHLRPTAFSMEGQLSQQVYEGVLLPLTEQSYIDMGLGFKNRSEIGPDGYVDILRVGRMEFDLDTPQDRRTIRQMTELLGPAWAVQAEANMNTQLEQDISDVYDRLQAGMLKPIGGREAMQLPERAALHALYTFGGGDIKKSAAKKGDKRNVKIKRLLPVGTTGAQFADYSTIMADSIVDFFIESGLESDGSDVMYSLLPGQDAFQDIEQTLAEEQVSQEISGVTAGRADIKSIVDTSLSAEAATREFIRELGELLTADLPKHDIQQRVGYDVNLGVVASQAATVARAMNNLAPAHGGLVNKIATASRMDAEQTIGELLSRKLDKYSDAKDLVEDGYKGQAYANTLGVTRSSVKDLLKSLQTEGMAGTFLTSIEKGSDIDVKRQNLRDMYDLMNDLSYDISTNDTAYIEMMDKYLQQDPDAVLLQKGIDRVQAQIIAHKDGLNMSLDKVSGTEAKDTVAAAISHIDFADQLFGVSGMRKMKAQIETMKLEKSYMAIFGMEPETKMRHIVKNVFKGSEDSKPRGAAGEYSLAMQFAADAMNSENPTETMDAQRTAIQTTIDNLNAKATLTTDENFALGQYQNYLASMDKVAEIVNSEGEYGQKLNSWLKTDYKQMSDAFYTDVVSQSKFAGERQNFYSPRTFIQEMTEETPEFMMSQITGRMLERKYDTLAGHLTNGKVLKFDNFLINALEAQNQSIEALSNQQMISANLFDGFFSLKPQTGYSVLKPAGSKLYALKVTVNGEIKGRAKDFDAAKEFAAGYKDAKIEGEYHDVYAPNEIATYFNKITATSPLRSNKFLMGLMSLNAKLKAIRINFGMFHRRGLLWSAIMAGELNPDYKDQKGIVNKLKSRFDYQNRREAGMDMIKEFSPEMMALNYYGMTLFQIQDIGKENLQNKTRIEKFMSGGKRGEATKITGKGAKAFEDMTSRLQGELFGMFGSSLKTATAFNELVALTEKNQEQITKEKQESQKTNTLSKHALAYNKVFGEASVEFKDYYSAKEEEIYRVVAGMANADFGGLHMGRLGVSKGAQDVMRMLLLGPDWTYSNIISAMKALPGTGKSGNISGVGTNFAGTELEKKVYQAFWLRILGRSLAIATAINLLMAGIDDESAIERFTKAKKRGKFNVLKADISPMIHLLGGDRETDHYLNTLGHFLDPAKIALDPIRMAYHKSSTVAKPVADLISGTRYDMKRPTKISKIGSEGLYSWKSGKRGPLSPAELPSFALWQAMQLLPIQAKNVFDLMGGEQNVITGLMTTGAGLDVSRTYAR